MNIFATEQGILGDTDYARQHNTFQAFLTLARSIRKQLGAHFLKRARPGERIVAVEKDDEGVARLIQGALARETGTHVLLERELAHGKQRPEFRENFRIAAARRAVVHDGYVDLVHDRLRGDAQQRAAQRFMRVIARNDHVDANVFLII